LRSVVVQFFSRNLTAADSSILSVRSSRRNNLFEIGTAYRNVHTRRLSGLNRVGMYVGAGMCIVGGASVLSYFSNTSPVSAAKSASPDQNAKPTRMVL